MQLSVTERAAPSAQGDAAVRSLIESVGAITRLARHAESMTGSKFSRVQLVMLGSLRRHGKQRITELARASELELSVASRQIAFLADAGLVVRTRDADDGRVCLVALTDRGKRALSRVRAGQRRWVREALAEWSDEQISQAAEILGDIVEAWRLRPMPS